MLQLKNNYHYLVAGLPDLLLDEGRQKSSVAFFKEEFGQKLHRNDFDLVKYLFLKFDNANLLNLLNKNSKAFLDQGNYTREFLEEQIKEPDHRILPYLKDFIVSFKAGEREPSDASWETILDNEFFIFLLNTKNDFLRNWFQFKLNFQNVTTALACRDHKISPEKYLTGTNTVTEIILRSNANDFGLHQEFPEVEKILQAWQHDTIIEREQALDQFKWEWIDEQIFFHYFTIERLLGFLLQLEMVERWMKLDEKTGQKMFDLLLGNMNKEYELPEEFNLQYGKRK